MNKQMRDMMDGARLGGMVGFAVGALFQGITFAIPGGRELQIARATAVIIPKTISLSGRAVGTLVGAAVGARQGRHSQNC